jgi:predicted HicB family RNase H-like nuclease
LKQNKAKRIGRPKLPKGEAMGRIVSIRFAPDDIKAVAQAAKADKKTLSEWIRSAVNAAIQR